MFYLLAFLYLLYAPLPTLYIKLLHRPREDKLLFSFDDGPSDITHELLDLLKEQEIHAIFFLLAGEAKKYPSLIKRMVREGHEIGLHGSTHRNHLFLGPISTYLDLKEAWDTLGGFGPLHLARLPYGNVNLISLLTLKVLGLRHMGWDHLLKDWRLKPRGVLKNKLLHLKSGVVLLHDGTMGSADLHAKEMMLHELKDYLKKRDNEEKSFSPSSQPGTSEYISGF